MDELDHLVWGLGIVLVICISYFTISGRWTPPYALATGIFLVLWQVSMIFKIKDAFTNPREKQK